MAGNFIMNLVLSAGLNQMLSMVETQQILLVPPLFMLAIPAAVATFFKFVMEIAAFDLIPTELLFEKAFGWVDTSDSVNVNFEAEGFGSHLFLFNIGSILIILILWIPALCLHIFCKCFIQFFCCGDQEKCLRDRRQKLKDFVFWTHPIITLYESYVIICLCTFINMNYVKRETPQESFSYGLAYMFYVICVSFPLITILYLCKNYNRLQLKRVRGSCGVIYRNLNLRKGRIVLVQPFWFLLRRFILAYICVNPPGGVLFFQFFIMQYTIYVQVLISGYIKPLKDRASARMEFVNESIITLIFYTFLCFSDLAPDAESRVIVGFFSCMLVVLHFVANLLMISCLSLKACREKARKKRLRKKIAKLRSKGEIPSDKISVHKLRTKIVNDNLQVFRTLERNQDFLKAPVDNPEIVELQTKIQLASEIRCNQLKWGLEQAADDFAKNLDKPESCANTSMLLDGQTYPEL